MEILGYIGFVILVFLAITWTFGVRKELAAGIPTILGALYFLIALISLIALKADKLHSFWIIPLGFALPYFLTLLSIYLPILYAPLKLIASIFAGIVRLGIPQYKIDRAMEADMIAVMERFKEQHTKK